MDLTGIACSGGSANSYQTGLWRQGKKPLWDPKKCKQCFICVNDCPEDCILRREGEVYGINYDYCKGCGICAEMCPFKAITMMEEKQ